MKYINKKRLIDTFCELAKIKSPSGHEQEIARLLIKRLKALGLKVTQDAYGNVISRLSGHGRAIILCAHMDTVAIGPGKEIIPIIKGNTIRSNGKTILGADNKDSVAAILESLSVVTERNLPIRPVEIIFTREEEAISKGARNLDFSLITGKECIIADASYPYGTIILSAPYNYNFEIMIQGKRSHAAVPEKGKNAASIAFQAASRISLGKIDKFTRVNISFGVIGLRGNADQKIINLPVALRTRNNVPDYAHLYGEVRGAKIELVKKTLDKIKAEFEKAAREVGARSVFSVQKQATGYYYTKSDPLIKEIIKVLQAQNKKSAFTHSLGGSDANILASKGIKAVVISSPGLNPHTFSEYLKIPDLVLLADFYFRVMTK